MSEAKPGDSNTDESSTETQSTSPPVNPDQVEITKAKLALAGALGAAIISGLFGIFQVLASGSGGDGNKPSPPARSTGAGNGNSSRTPTSAAPRSQTPSGDATSPSEPTPAEYKNIDLPAGYVVTFADDPPHPLYTAVGVGYEGDFGYQSDGSHGVSFMTPHGNTLVLLKSNEKGSLHTCEEKTRYTNRIDREDVIKGSQICIKTHAGHVGLVTFQGYSPEGSSSDYATIDLTVWRRALSKE